MKYVVEVTVFIPDNNYDVTGKGHDEKQVMVIEDDLYEECEKGYCDTWDMSAVAAALECYNMDFEACAEPELVNLSKNVKMTGCISAKDLRLMGLPLEGNAVNPQNRKGCKCLACKTELLSNRRQCPHGCVYCYWR